MKGASITRSQLEEIRNHPNTEGRTQALAVRVQGITKRYQSDSGAVHALGPIDMSVEQGRFVSIVGPSGCGKSTLLNIIAGFVFPTDGDVYVLDALTRGIDTNCRIGYVPQDNRLFPWLRTAANIEFPLKAQGWPKARRRQRVDELLALVGVTQAANQFIYQLSGGMRKRVAIAQALSYDPVLLLMDEPFGSLDSQTRMLMHEELLRIWQKTQKTVIFVTHDMVEAIALSDRVFVMSRAPGTLKAEIAVEMTRPRDIFYIHGQTGFDSTYEKLWPLLHDELVRNA